MHSSPREPRRRDPEAPLWKQLPRNVTGILLFEFLWGLGMPFGLYISMVPAYLTALGSSKSLMGFVQSLWTALIPLQLLGGHFFASRGRVHALMSFWMIGCFLPTLASEIRANTPG